MDIRFPVKLKKVGIKLTSVRSKDIYQFGFEAKGRTIPRFFFSGKDRFLDEECRIFSASKQLARSRLARKSRMDQNGDNSKRPRIV